MMYFKGVFVPLCQNVPYWLHPNSDMLLWVRFLLWIVVVWLQTSQSLVKFHYLPSSCACCSPSDPGHYCGNGPGGPEGDALSQGRSSSVVSDENCRVSGMFDLYHHQTVVNIHWELVLKSTPVHSCKSFCG